MPNTLADTIAALAARISALLGPRAMRAIARFNKRVTNPIQRRWAQRLPHMAVIEHEGRTSATIYQTPVMAFVDAGTLSVVLNYGSNSDWVRNLLAAGSGAVMHRGERYRLTESRIISVDSADLPDAVRAIGTTARAVLHGTLVRDGPNATQDRE